MAQLPQGSLAKLRPVHHVHKRGSAHSPGVPRQSVWRYAEIGWRPVVGELQLGETRPCQFCSDPRGLQAWVWSISEETVETKAGVIMTTPNAKRHRGCTSVSACADVPDEAASMASSVVEKDVDMKYLTGTSKEIPSRPEFSIFFAVLRIHQPHFASRHWQMS